MELLTMRHNFAALLEDEERIRVEVRQREQRAHFKNV